MKRGSKIFEKKIVGWIRDRLLLSFLKMYTYSAEAFFKQRRWFEEEIVSYLGRQFLSHPFLARLGRVSFLGILNYLMDIPKERQYSRYDHTLGVTHLTLRCCKNLSLPFEETLIALISSLVHDIGHGPFSHSSEPILLWLSGYYRTHHSTLKSTKIEKLLKDCIMELPPPLIRRYQSLAEIVETIYFITHGFHPQKWNNAITPHLETIMKLFNHPLCPDAFDGDNRAIFSMNKTTDFGLFDPEVLVDAISGNRELFIVDSDKAGLISNFVRMQERLYREIFFSDWLRAGEAMFVRAIELISSGPFSYSKLTDYDLIHKMQKNRVSAEIWARITTNKLLRPLSSIAPDELSRSCEEFPGIFLSGIEFWKEKQKLESALAKRLNIQREFVILHRFKTINWQSYNLYFSTPIFAEHTRKNLIEAKWKTSQGKPRGIIKKVIEIYVP